MAHRGDRRGPGAPGGGQPHVPRDNGHHPFRARPNQEELLAAGRNEKMDKEKLSKKSSPKDSVEFKNDQLREYYIELKRLNDVVSGAKGPNSKGLVSKAIATYGGILEGIKILRGDIKKMNGVPEKMPNKLSKMPKPKA